MKKYIGICVLGIAICSNAVSAEESLTIVPGRITETVVFSGEALVNRAATAKVVKGMNRIGIELREFSVDADSVQARVFGGGELVSVQVKDVQEREMPQERIAVLQKKIDELEKSRRGLADQAAVLQKKEGFLNAVVEFAKVEVPKDIKTAFPSVENLDKALLFLDAQFGAVNKGKADLDDAARDLDKTLDAARREMDGLTGPGGMAKKVIEIVFKSDADQEVKIEAQYLAQNAGWQPQYKVDVSSDLKKVGLVMFGAISQKTGEEWQGVGLSLSNVIPLKGAELPSLGSWIVDIPRPVPAAPPALMRMAAMSKKMEMAEFSADNAPTASAPPEPAAFAAAEAAETPTAFEYRFSQKLDIPSDERETLLPVFAKEMSGSFFYYAVPKQGNLTYLVCRAKPDRELLAAPVSIYFGGRYVGKMSISERTPGEEFDIGLGADRGVAVDRATVKDKVVETSFFGKIERKTIVRELHFKITVENMKDQPVKVRVLDSIPVSRTDKVEVKDVQLSPEPAQKGYRDQEGVMLWEISLNPKEKKEITIDFTVAYPKDTPVTNL
ncbi:MAG TPA: mucoidy inhibitor MuiA family protein [bacterium]|nr:mucoidy inhibitor MuiA family protein [bacterium]